MDYTIRTESQATVIALRGEFTFADHEAYRGVTDAFRAAANGHIVIDLSGLSFVDSAGLGMLLIARQVAEKVKSSLVLRGAREQVRHMLSVAKFDTIMTIED